MELLLPWWGWLLSGASGAALLWLLSVLVFGGQRRALRDQLNERQRQIEHLNTQRNDREARVLRLEQRLSDSERDRLLAETRQNERDATIVELQARLRVFDGLQAEVDTLRARAATLEADLGSARERLLALDEERTALANERGALQTQLDAANSELAEQRAEVARLRDEHETTTFAVAQQQAQIALAEGEREASMLREAINRAYQTRGADLMALTSLRTELGEFRDDLYRARRRLQTLAHEGLSKMAAATTANEVAEQLGQRTNELLELGRTHQLIGASADGGSALDGEQGGAGGFARGLFGYLREAFERAVESGRVAEPARERPDEAEADEVPTRSDQV